MRDRLFWTTAIGIAPLTLIALAFARFSGAPGWVGTPGWPAAVVVEALLLWKFADPGLTEWPVRARRVGLGLLVTFAAATIIGAVLLVALLMIAFGRDG